MTTLTEADLDRLAHWASGPKVSVFLERRHIIKTQGEIVVDGAESVDITNEFAQLIQLARLGLTLLDPTEEE